MQISQLIRKSDSHHKYRLLVINGVRWFDVFDCFIFECEIQLRLNESNYAFPNVFGESFTQANPAATQERTITHWMAFFAIGSQVVWGCRIEAVREKLTGRNPLSRVVMQIVHVNNE